MYVDMGGNGMKIWLQCQLLSNDCMLLDDSTEKDHEKCNKLPLQFVCHAGVPMRVASPNTWDTPSDTWTVVTHMGNVPPQYIASALVCVLSAVLNRSYWRQPRLEIANVAFCSVSAFGLQTFILRITLLLLAGANDSLLPLLTCSYRRPSSLHSSTSTMASLAAWPSSQSSASGSRLLIIGTHVARALQDMCCLTNAALSTQRHAGRDLLLLACMTLLFGLLGLPPVNGVLPQAPMHTRSLARPMGTRHVVCAALAE
jgi:hypothetical protein